MPPQPLKNEIIRTGFAKQEQGYFSSIFPPHSPGSMLPSSLMCPTMWELSLVAVSDAAPLLFRLLLSEDGCLSRSAAAAPSGFDSRRRREGPAMLLPLSTDLSSFAGENVGADDGAGVVFVVAATAQESRPKSSEFPGWYRRPWLRRFSFLQ